MNLRLSSVSSLLLAAVFGLAATPAAFAGVAKGSISVGGALNLSSTDLDDGETKAQNDQTVFMANVDYFFADNMSFGLSPTWMSSKLKDKSGELSSAETTIFYLPFRLDYHWPLPEAKLTPFAGVDLGTLRVSSDDGEEEGSDSGILYGAHVGVRYFISEPVCVTAQINLFQTTGMDIDADMTSFTVGLNYIIGGE